MVKEFNCACVLTLVDGEKKMSFFFRFYVSVGVDSNSGLMRKKKKLVSFVKHLVRAQTQQAIKIATNKNKEKPRTDNNSGNRTNFLHAFNSLLFFRYYRFKHVVDQLDERRWKEKPRGPEKLSVLHCLFRTAVNCRRRK